MSRLSDLRKEKGYTQVKMQMLTGLDQSDYSKIENGKRYLTFEQCRKIALALNTSMEYLKNINTGEEKKTTPSFFDEGLPKDGGQGLIGIVSASV